MFGNGFHPVYAADFCFITLTGGNDFAIAGFQTETEFTGFIFKYFKFGMRFCNNRFERLIFDFCDRCVLFDAFNTIDTTDFGLIIFAGGNYLSV